MAFPRALFLLLVLCLPAASFAGDVTFKATGFSQLPGWQNSTSETLKSNSLKAFSASCEKILQMPDAKILGPNAGQVRHWKPACYKARGTLKRVKESQLPAEQDDIARRFFESTFAPYTMSAEGNKEGLFTGYYVPELKASRKKKGQYVYPIYGVPKDLQKDVPYKTRAQINAGALKGRGLELAYAKDPVMLFFMQVQGTGRVTFDDGSVTHMGFGAKNYQPYTALGKVLVEMGALHPEKVTAPIIMQWLYKHPDKAQKVMEKNASFIFFRELKEGGVLGAQSVALTPLASLAVDKEHVALGVPLWLDASLPVKSSKSAKTFRALFIAQDTGSAIKGPIRGDVFFGYGAKAEWMAGHMKQYGTYYMLLPKTVNPADEQE